METTTTIAAAVGLPAVLGQAGQVAAVLGPYLLVAVAFAFGPKLLGLGMRLIKGR